MPNTKKNTITAARRYLDRTSSMILHEIYLAYPKKISLKAMGKKLMPRFAPPYAGSDLLSIAWKTE